MRRPSQTRRRKFRENSIDKLINELRSMMPQAKPLFLKSVVRQIVKRQRKNGVGNSAEMAALIGEILRILKEKNKIPQQIRRVQQNVTSAQVIKKIELTTATRELPSGKTFRHNAAQEEFNSMQKYWRENGGERLVIRKYGSQPIIPTNNELTNEMGDPNVDDIGFAPMQQ